MYFNAVSKNKNNKEQKIPMQSLGHFVKTIGS